MFVYNVTVNVEDAIHDEWLQWMKEIHIPEVMATNLFESNKIFEVLVENETGKTYSIQYEYAEMESLQLYQEMYAAKLQADHLKRYGDKVLAFRTLLREEFRFSVPND